MYGTSTEDALGCPDTDGDGWSNSADAYPEDAAKYEASLLSGNLLYVGVPLVVALLFGLMLVRRRSASEEIPVFIDAESAPQPATPAGPPLPPEGLPPGWTMEQWAWYGEDYLKNR